MALRFLRALLPVTVLLACTPTSEPGPGPAAPAPLSLRWDGKPGASGWTSSALAASRAHGLAELVPQDIADWCPGYADASTDDRNAFWAGLMSALAKFESGHDPSVAFTESFPDSTGALVVSRGLLQLSRESAQGYGCPIATGEELHDPAVNLDCSARILRRWVSRDGVVSSKGQPWTGAARYWSPFRAADKRADMAAWTRAQPVCSAG